MRIEDITAFAAVIKYESLSRAAEALCLPQSVVTRRVQSFEQFLGVQLLDRNTKPLRPSKLGKRAYEQCRLILQQIETLKGLATVAEKPSGPMRIGVPQFISESMLADLVQALKAKFPELCLEITSGMSPTLLKALEDGDLDGALVVGSHAPATSPRVVSKRLASFEMEIVTAKTDGSRRPRALQDVCDRGWILNPGVCGFKHALERLLVSKKLPLKVNLDVFGTDVQLGLVADGLGLGLIPSRLFNKSPHYARIRRLNLHDFKMQQTIWLARPAHQDSSTSAILELGALVQHGFSACYD